jgi:hypothetical protein
MNGLRQLYLDRYSSFSFKDIEPLGWNGPYMDPESSVRYLSHDLVIRAKLGLLDVKDLNDFQSKIWQSQYRGKYNFYFRAPLRSDSANGLIGFAWFLEAVNVIPNVHLLRELRNWIIEVLKLCEDNSQDGLITIIPTYNGQINKTDYTFNHQLWFAHMAVEFCVKHEINSGLTYWRGHLRTLVRRNKPIRGLPIWHFVGLSPLRNAIILGKLMLKGELFDFWKKLLGYHYFAVLPVMWHAENGNVKINLKKYVLFNVLEQAAHKYSNKYGNPYNPVLIEAAAFKKKELDDKAAKRHEDWIIAKIGEGDWGAFSRLYELSYLNGGIQ